MELSNRKWKLRFGDGRKVRSKSLDAGEQDGLLVEIAKAKQRFGLPPDSAVRSCYEAGRDGFWIHRFLHKHGIVNLVVDPASIAVSRQKRRAKTDRLDAEKLLLMLLRYHLYGDKTTWKVCRVPSEQAEDERRIHRELDRLTKERTQHKNRIGSLLILHGVRSFDPRSDVSAVRDWDGRPLPGCLVQELEREQHRLELIEEQMREVRAEQKRRLVNPVSESDRKARKLTELKGIGPVSAFVLGKEFFGWRQFGNRRQVAAAAGLTGTPYNSGDSKRDQGISKAGSKWVRKRCVELAWFWVRYQPQSPLTQWFVRRFGGGNARMRRIGIVALARKLLIALWRYVEHDEFPEDAVLYSSFVR